MGKPAERRQKQQIKQTHTWLSFVSPDFRLSHFDYVKNEDLEKIGMGKPAVRRLLDAVKQLIKLSDRLLKISLP